MGLWVSKESEAAEAWFAKAKADGAFESKQLSNLMSLESTLQQHRIAGLLRSRPDIAEKEITTQTPPDPVLTSSFARNLGMTGKAQFKAALDLAEARPAGAERERALTELGESRWSGQQRTRVIPSVSLTPDPASKP